MNGTGKRYSTRVATGSIQRKNYNRVLSDHSNQENDSMDESGDERVLRKTSSKGVVNHPQILPKGSSRRRARIASDSDDNVKPKAKHRKVQSASSEEAEEDDEPTPKRVSRARGLQKTLRSSKCNHVEEDEEDEEEKSDESEDESEVDGINDTAHSNTSAEESEEEEDEEEEEEEEDAEEDSGVTTRATRSSLRNTSTKPIRTSHERPSSSHSDYVSVSRSTSRQRYRTRNRGQRTVVYREDSEDNEAASEEEVTSVSSRGRIRRITPRARALFS